MQPKAEEIRIAHEDRHPDHIVRMANAYLLGSKKDEQPKAEPTEKMKSRDGVGYKLCMIC